MRTAAGLVILALALGTIGAAPFAGADHGPYCHLDVHCCGEHENGPEVLECEACVAITGYWLIDPDQCAW